MNNYTDYYRRLHNDVSIPQDHIDYLKTIQYTPSVAYDIGSSVLHWTKEAKKIWPNTRYINFEAVEQVDEFYKEMKVEYAIGVFSDENNNEVTFYCNPICLGGNSYYKENEKYSSAAKEIYSKEFEESRHTTTIDSTVNIFNFPLPDLVKIDVQGAELDILKGMTNTLKSVKHLIIELQHVEYNIGAKQANESIPFIESLGFKLVPTNTGDKYFCGNGPDADYHFIKK
jgi:FkbM family methyltransferase